ncbi:MAG: toll/interleukin-1 receptor domain-containing protein, partial [Leptolyngbyaceae cyanobacterium]
MHQDVFISYGRRDSLEFATYLNQRLIEAGYSAWFDFEDIPQGVDYQKQIDDGIEKADNFLFIIAPHATNSPYCRKEIELAVSLNKRLVPIIHVEEISQETWQSRNPNGTDADWDAYQAQGLHSCFTNLHPELAKINWNQVSYKEGINDFEQSFQALLDIFERQKDYVQQHTVLLNQALDWERNQKRTQFLLIGEERQRAEAWLATQFKTEQAPCSPADLHCEYITESIKNANNLMTQVFLCHAEADREIAEQVRLSLMRNGITTWTHRSDIEFGSDFQAAMTRGMEDADNVVFLLSTDALESQYCQQELNHALELNKRIIPLRVGAVDPEQVPSSLQTLQYIDLTDNLTEADYLKDESDLLRILKRQRDYHHEHKVLLTKALKWERQQRNPCILLRGYELQHAEAWQKLAQQHQYGPLPLQTEFIQASQQQPPGISLDVFVSYSRADSDFARKLNDGLQRQGKRTWFDQESIASGADFQQEIYKGIEASDHFLFILSPKSVNSPYCADEVEYAAKLNKRIITARHRAVEAAELHPELAKVQWIDFLGRDRDFAANFKELIRTLDADPEHLRFHTR